MQSLIKTPSKKKFRICDVVTGTIKAYVMRIDLCLIPKTVKVVQRWVDKIHIDQYIVVTEKMIELSFVTDAVGSSSW